MFRPDGNLRRLLPILTAVIVIGCRGGDTPLKYLGDAPLDYYKEAATQIDFPVLDEESLQKPLGYEPPRRIRRPHKDDLWDLTLQEAIHIAMANSHIMRTRGQFLSTANPLFVAANQVTSVYDLAIQETGVQNGARGVEAALSDFDTRFTTNMLWGRNELVQNNRFLTGLPPGATLADETGVFVSRFEKTFANGGTAAFNHNWNYSGNNVPTRLFNSVYTGVLQVEYRQPLLQGAGVENNRIMGLIGRNLPGVSTVDQGVLIARINNDISIADFEAGVRNLLKDVEDAYWDLVLAYRVYDIEVGSRNKTLEIWRKVKGREAPRADEAQARDNYYENRARSENALADLYQIEAQLRRLLGLPVNDGRVIRPLDEPMVGEFAPDWHVSLAESLTRRVELRKQKWNIKSFELQLKAAHSLVRPRLDFVSNYQRNAFGDRLLSNADNDPVTLQGFHNAYETLTQGFQTGWNLGFEFSMPLGLRAAHAQVQNIELRLAKARAVLAEQEHEISHELANAFQQLDRNYKTAQTNLNRQQAAKERVEAFEVTLEALPGQVIDPLLRSQISFAQAQIAYYRSVIQYNKSITDINFRKGTLLDSDNVFLAEGDWDPQAYRMALRRATGRSHALDTKLLHTEPTEFVLGEHAGFSDPYDHYEYDSYDEEGFDDLELEPLSPTPDPTPADPLVTPPVPENTSTGVPESDYNWPAPFPDDNFRPVPSAAAQDDWPAPRSEPDPEDNWPAVQPVSQDAAPPLPLPESSDAASSLPLPDSSREESGFDFIDTTWSDE